MRIFSMLILFFTMLLFLALDIHATDCADYESDGYFVLAQGHADANNYLNAIEFYTCVTDSESTDLIARSYLGRAAAYIALADYPSAQEDIEILKTLPYSVLGTIMIESVLFIERDGLSAGIAFINDSITENPELDFLYILVGLLYAENDQSGMAVDSFSRYISSHGERAIIFAERGFAYESLGQDALAEQDFERAITLDSDVGLLYSENFFDADSEIIQGFLRDPNNLSILFYRAIFLSPDLPILYLARGEFYSLLGWQTRAYDDFTEALDLDPDNVTALRNLSIIEYAQGNVEESLDLLAQAIEIDPENADLHTRRGAIYLLQEDVSLAIEELDIALALDDTYAFAYSVRGAAYTINERWTLALRDIENAVLYDPYNPDYLFQLAAFYEEFGLLEDALVYYDMYADFLIDPVPPQTQIRIDRIREEVSD